MPRPSVGALLQTGAFTLATILGSGILGLPVTLVDSGLPPFILSFCLTLVAQLGVIHATAELLQRACARQAQLKNKQRVRRDAAQRLPYGLTTISSEPRDTITVSMPPLAMLPRAGGVSMDGVTPGGRDYNAMTWAAVSAVDEDAAPGLHSFAELYLPQKSLRILFEICVMLHFVSIMSSYATAAPQAFKNVVPFIRDISETTLVMSFTLVASIIVIFFGETAVTPLTIATCFKGGLLTAVVGVVLVFGAQVRESPSTDWSLKAGLEPFLMGTLALSGVVNLMPKLWDICVKSTGRQSRDAVDKTFVRSYLLAIDVGVVFCFVLNILWCVGVLLVVPQKATEAPSRIVDAAVSVRDTVPGLARMAAFVRADITASDVLTLQIASDHGKISTVPLAAVLSKTKLTGSSLVGGFVNLFVFVSISVSFMVMGIGLTQLLDEISDSFFEWRAKKSSARQAIAGASPSGEPALATSSEDMADSSSKRATRVMISLSVFGFIALFSATNPDVLLEMMSGFTSLALNLEGGLLIMLMFYNSRHMMSGRSAVDGGSDLGSNPSTPPSRSQIEPAFPSPAFLGPGTQYEDDEAFGGFDREDIPAPVPEWRATFLIIFVSTFFLFAVGIDLVYYIPQKLASRVGGGAA